MTDILTVLEHRKNLDELNIESKFIDGLRVTDEITIKVVEEALLELRFSSSNRFGMRVSLPYHPLRL